MNIIEVSFGTKTRIKTRPLYQFDSGTVLRITDTDLPEAFRADFSNDEFGESKPVYCSSHDIPIPYEFMIPGETVHCWIVFSDMDSSSTKYYIQVPIDKRAVNSDVAPTPSQRSALDEALAVLTNINGSVEEALQNAMDSGVFNGPQGEKGNKGDKGDPGTPGARGGAGYSPTVELVPIMNPDNTVSTQITITDQQGAHTFTVTDGAKGEKGDKGDKGDPGTPGARGGAGYSPAVTLEPTLNPDNTTSTRITIIDQQGSHVFTVSDGAKGDKGDKGDRGYGIADGGTADQLLQKTSSTDYFTRWVDPQRVVFYGLAKAAGDNTQASSQNSVGLYTPNAKANILNMLGINSMIAPDETDLTANRDYAAGEYFTFGGSLFKATSAIAQNGTIVPGTNCQSTTIAHELTLLFSALSGNE